jgi:5-methylthioribose kinase
MFEITARTAGEYLHSSGRLESGDLLKVQELAGGVSNVVFLVELPARSERFVLKQARGRLRVAADWHCPVERIWREIDTLRICRQLVTRAPSASMSWQPIVPEILWEDRENFCYAMTAAPADHRTWKECLLGGDLTAGRQIAAAAGELLAQLHANSWHSPAIAAALADQSYFEALRIDPYYRHLVRNRPELAGYLQPLIDSLGRNTCALVHGDFSPKNLLVWPQRLMLIDFEVGHFGDPSFDLGFFLTHLVLKEIWSRAISPADQRGRYLALAHEFWQCYRSRLGQTISEPEIRDLERRMIQHLAGCVLARVDGKSPVDYLPASAVPQVRQLAVQLFSEGPVRWDEAASLIP